MRPRNHARYPRRLSPFLSERERDRRRCHNPEACPTILPSHAFLPSVAHVSVPKEICGDNNGVLFTGHIIHRVL
ncbi:unnamed protein product [Victoria cruziana]